MKTRSLVMILLTGLLTLVLSARSAPTSQALVEVEGPAGSDGTGLPHDTLPASSQWVRQTVDTNGGWGASLVLDATQLPHIAYDCGNFDLCYARLQGAEWVKQTVATTGGEASLALDTQGRPHISFGNGSLKYTTFDGSRWREEVVDSNGDEGLGRNSSLVLDSNGRPHITYYGGEPAGGVGEYRHATHDGTRWNVRRIASDARGNGAGVTAGLVLGAGNHLHTVYNARDGVRYAYFDGAAWRTQFVSAGAAGSIALAPDQSVHVAFIQTGYLKYGSLVGSEWRFQDVASMTAAASDHKDTGFVGLGATALKFDSQGQPHIAYRYGSEVGTPLAYAYRVAARWLTETVDTEGRPGWSHVSLAIDRQDHPRLAYLSDYSDEQLRYAARQAPISENFAIILLPGIMGSRLANNPRVNNPPPGRDCQDRAHGEIWPAVRATLDDPERLKTLYLRADGPEPVDPCDNISPTEPIYEFWPWADFYRHFVDTLEGDGFDVYEIAYDWRKDIDTIAQDVAAAIDRQIGSQRRFILVGHSMGGLVARAFMTDPTRGQRVAKVITVGTPYLGAPILAQRMRSGTTGLPFDALIPDYLIRNIIRNSPGIMELLPSQAYMEDGQPYYYREGHAGLGSYERTMRFFEDQGQNARLLALAGEFHRRYDTLGTLGIPYHILALKDKNTPRKIREFGCEQEGTNTCWSVEGLADGGDGTVPWKSALLGGNNSPRQGTATVCTFARGAVSQEHAELLRNDNVIADIKHILRGENPQHCSQSLAKAEQAPGPFIEVAVQGSREVTADDGAGHVTGLNEDGWIISDIPESSYRLLGPGASLVLPATGVYNLTIKQNTARPIQVRVTQLVAPAEGLPFDPQQRALFVDVPASPGGVANLRLDAGAGLAGLQLLVDRDNSGAPDTVMAPTSVLDQQQSLDYASPTTSITIQGNQDGRGFYQGPVTLYLSAQDIGTGILKTEYSLDGGRTWRLYGLPLHVMAEDAPVIYARSVDRAGNHEYPWLTQRLRPYNVYLPLVADNPPLLPPQPPPAPGQLEIIEGLRLSTATPRVGESVTAWFSIKNTGGEAVTVRQLAAGAWGPNCADFPCPDVYFPSVLNLTLLPGEEHRYAAQRSFLAPGSYFAYPAFEDTDGYWNLLSPSPRVFFNVINEASGARGDAPK